MRLCLILVILVGKFPNEAARKRGPLERFLHLSVYLWLFHLELKTILAESKTASIYWAMAE